MDQPKHFSVNKFRLQRLENGLSYIKVTGRTLDLSWKTKCTGKRLFDYIYIPNPYCYKFKSVIRTLFFSSGDSWVGVLFLFIKTAMIFL